MIQELKLYPEYFQAKIDGIKPWEYRINDRGFMVGDILILREFDPDNGYSGRAISVKVEFVYHPSKNHVILSDDSAKKINWISLETIR